MTRENPFRIINPLYDGISAQAVYRYVQEAIMSDKPVSWNKCYYCGGTLHIAQYRCMDIGLCLDCARRVTEIDRSMGYE